MVPVNEVATQGQPRLVIRDLPPVSSQGAPEIKRAAGLLRRAAELLGRRRGPPGRSSTIPRQSDGGPKVVETRWTGTTGIKLDTTLSRLLFALRFRDLDLLISDQITADSQLLFHRSLADRLPRIAPFLLYDKDPYVVVRADGSARLHPGCLHGVRPVPALPAVRPERAQRRRDRPDGLNAGSFNYIRNSVKIVVDAYDGTMTFYANDPNDPLMRAWQGVFPTLFQPMSRSRTTCAPTSASRRNCSTSRRRSTARYHVQNPLTYYSQDDLWTVPTGQTTKQSLSTEAYYVIMRCPRRTRPSSSSSSR